MKLWRRKQQPHPRYAIEEWNAERGDWVLLPHAYRHPGACRNHFNDLAMERGDDGKPIRMVKLIAEVLHTQGELSPEDARVAEGWEL